MILLSLAVQMVLYVLFVLPRGEASAFDVVLCAVFGVAYLASAFGALLYRLEPRRWAFVLAVAGFVPYLPVGAVGILGLVRMRKNRCVPSER